MYHSIRLFHIPYHSIIGLPAQQASEALKLVPQAGEGFVSVSEWMTRVDRIGFQATELGNGRRLPPRRQHLFRPIGTSLMSEDRGFEINDRRQVSPADDDVVTEADAEEYGEGMPPMEVTVQGVLRFSVEMLSNRAWVCMGLTPNPMTGKIDRNLPEAKRAIDVLGALAPHAETDADPNEKRELRNLLADLRVNFLRQSSSPE